jgi:uncharacterized protein YndB with AHSA1/START domain
LQEFAKSKKSGVCQKRKVNKRPNQKQPETRACCRDLEAAALRRALTGADRSRIAEHRAEVDPEVDLEACTGSTTRSEESHMVDILHRVGIKSSSSDDVYKALTTREGLSAWWTNNTQGETKVGGVLQFRFGAAGGFDMKVLELHPAERVLWQVVDGPKEWIGTKVSWELKEDGDYTIVLFKHQGWKEPVEFMHHCSTKWGVFLMSLKSLLETGKSAPWPNDIKIDNWN